MTVLSLQASMPLFVKEGSGGSGQRVMCSRPSGPPTVGSKLLQNLGWVKAVGGEAGQGRGELGDANARVPRRPGRRVCLQGASSRLPVRAGARRARPRPASERARARDSERVCVRARGGGGPESGALSLRRLRLRRFQRRQRSAPRSSSGPASPGRSPGPEDAGRVEGGRDAGSGGLHLRHPQL